MRQVAVLIGVLFVALIFNSILPKGNGADLDRATVEKFIIEDARTTYGEFGSYKIVKFEKPDSKWAVELDITLNYNVAPGTPASCSKTFRRYYELFPIKYREELYKSTC
ncbi:MAG: hypothetical protein AABX01_00330 [Candidatus Micrarchaeota archaeon]